MLDILDELLDEFLRLGPPILVAILLDLVVIQVDEQRADPHGIGRRVEEGVGRGSRSKQAYDDEYFYGLELDLREEYQSHGLI